MTDQELNQIKEIQKKQLGGIFVTAEDVTVIFKALVESIKTTRSTLQNELETGDSKNLDKCVTLYKELESSISDCEYRLTSLITSSKEETRTEAYKAIQEEIQGLKQSIKDFDASYLETRIAEVEDKIPSLDDVDLDTPEEIRDKLESIVIESEKLRIEAIKDLRKELDELRRMISKSGSRHYSLFGGGGGALGGGRIVRSYDLSPQLDGVTKTFQLPAMWRVISIHLSSSPTVLRETTDYTWTPTSVTFTSEIIESASLAAGQTAIIIYAEA